MRLAAIVIVRVRVIVQLLIVIVIVIGFRAGHHEADAAEQHRRDPVVPLRELAARGAVAADEIGTPPTQARAPDN